MTRHNHVSFTQASTLTQLAERIIVDGAPAVLHCSVSARERREWENAARRFLAAQADGIEDEDFADMVDDFYDEPDGYGPPECDLIYGERAETSVWVMSA